MAVVAPSRSPQFPDNSILYAVLNHGNSVIFRGRTGNLVQYARFLLQENIIASSQSNRDQVLVNRCLNKDIESSVTCRMLMAKIELHGPFLASQVMIFGLKLGALSLQFE